MLKEDTEKSRSTQTKRLVMAKKDKGVLTALTTSEVANQA